MNTSLVYEAVYKLCEMANTRLPKEVWEKLASYDHKDRDKILQNTYLAAKKHRPLCQDTGQVVVFLDLGQDVSLEGEYIESAINRAVSDCYRDKFYRKSIVHDALFSRANTKTNTPCIIHTKIVEGAEVKILVALKGGGAENTSQVRMFNPTASQEDVFEFIKKVASDAGENACPPMALGVGIGGTIEEACLLAKRALYFGNELDIETDNVFNAKMLTSSTHIASMPVCVNVNCHSDRYAKCKIADNNIFFEDESYEVSPCDLNFAFKKFERVKTDDIEKLKSLKSGDKILLSGDLYTARDMAHKKMTEEGPPPSPFNLKNKLIFYAGPCPAAPNEAIGPIGPTTSKRMDPFVKKMSEYGVLGSIGKGVRNAHEGLYFKLTGGVACLVQECVKKAEIVAYPELGAEAVYKLEVEDLPLELD